MGDRFGGGLFEREISVFAAENDHGKSRRLPVGAGANSPPVALGIDDHNLLVGRKQLFRKTPAGIAFSSSALRQDREALGDRFERQPEVIGNMQFFAHPPFTFAGFLESGGADSDASSPGFSRLGSSATQTLNSSSSSGVCVASF